MQFLFSFSLPPWAAIYNTESNRKRRKSKCTYTSLLVFSAGSLLRPVQPNHTQCALFYHTESTMLKLIKLHSDIPQITLIGAYLSCQENKSRNCVTVIKMAGHK